MSRLLLCTVPLPFRCWLLEECASTGSPRHSRDLRGARVLSPSVILHSSSPSFSPTQKHTLPASPLSLSLFFSPPFLAVLTDQITSPLFQVVKRVFCVLPYSISINFCSSSVFLNDTKDYLEENLKNKSSINSKLPAVSTISSSRH